MFALPSCLLRVEITRHLLSVSFLQLTRRLTKKLISVGVALEKQMFSKSDTRKKWKKKKKSKIRRKTWVASSFVQQSNFRFSLGYFGGVFCIMCNDLTVHNNLSLQWQKPTIFDYFAVLFLRIPRAVIKTNMMAAKIKTCPLDFPFVRWPHDNPSALNYSNNRSHTMI